MRFNNEDYKAAERFYNGETEWRDKWAEPAEDNPAVKVAKQMREAFGQIDMSKTYGWATKKMNKEDWEEFTGTKEKEMQRFVKMSVEDWKKVKETLLEVAMDDLSDTRYKDAILLSPNRASDIADLLCDIKVTEVDNGAMISDDGAWGRCGSCDYEFNSELRGEYGIIYCPKCGTKILEDI